MAQLLFFVFPGPSLSVILKLRLLRTRHNEGRCERSKATPTLGEKKEAASEKKRRPRSDRSALKHASDGTARVFLPVREFLSPLKGKPHKKECRYVL